MTTRGFWLVDAESRYTSGCPLISCSRIGKSRRSAYGSSVRTGSDVSVIAVGARLAGGLHGLEVGAGRCLGHEQCLIGQLGLVAVLAQDRAVAFILEAKGEVLPARGDDPALREDVDEIRRDVVQQALVVGDEQDTEVRVEHRVDA